MTKEAPGRALHILISIAVGIAVFAAIAAATQTERFFWVMWGGILSAHGTYALLGYISRSTDNVRSSIPTTNERPIEKVPMKLRETKPEPPPYMLLHLLKKSGARIGPCSTKQALDMISSGELGWDDLCWKEGMAEWAPLHTVLERPAHVPPPPPRASSTPPPPPPAFRAQVSAPAPSAATVSLGQRIDAGALFFGYGICVAASFFMESSGAHPAMLVLVALAAMAVFAVLHYQCWKHVPVQYRQMDPTKAVGLMLIPLFNFYWAFVALPALAESMNRWAAGAGTGTRSAASLVTLAQVYATVSVVSLAVTIFEPFPVVIFLAYAADLVCFVWFFRAVIGVQHRLAAA